MKSALELALEKTAKLQEGGPLTDEQRAEIADTEKFYQAKIAEQEIMLQSKLKSAAIQLHGADFSEVVGELRRQLGEEKDRLEREKAGKITAIRERNK